jgi:phospholipase C
MVSKARRGFLKLAAGGAAASATATAAPCVIDQALAAPARNEAGSIMDVEHVVILMQENRSFDHYFGCMKGVRGFGDPRAVTLPGGKAVWFQPTAPGADTHVAPFRLDGRKTSAETIKSLDHSWKGSHAAWKNHDNWIEAKTPMTMGHFTRDDIPFYYALADAFTVCDAYHASMFGPTNPNRMYLFTGTSGVNVGLTNSLAVANPLAETNETADPARDGPKFPGFSWTTYAERLETAGVSWKVYQEYDNYGDNGLAYFKAFRGVDPSSPLYRKGRAWAEGSNAENAKASLGEHLVAAFEKDVAGGSLPQVSWIVAPTALCEHPEGSPSYGEQFTARLIGALAAHPEVWAKTVFILNYDENDGFFDHVPPPVPAVAGAAGKSNVETSGEVYTSSAFGPQPIGLGPRVPMIVVSPWSKGGFVNSELFDHTSVLRFLEARFGVHEPNITPWRRAICGDLTSAFDFKTPNAAMPRLPDTGHYVARVDLTAKLPKPAVPVKAEPLPKQEPGQRPARPLPYDLHVAGALANDGFHLTFANRGTAGAAFQVYAVGVPEGPWFYTVAADSQLSDVILLPPGDFDVTVHGPNGYRRRYKGHGVDPASPTSALKYDAQRLTIVIANPGSNPATVIVANAYGGKPQSKTLPAKGSAEVVIPLQPTAHWYDIGIAWKENPAYVRRFAGHVETGEPSLSDPAIGAGEGGLAAGLLKRLKI